MAKTRVAMIGAALAFALASCAEVEVRLPGERLDIHGAPAAAPISQDRAISLPAVTNNAAWTHRAATPTHIMPHAALSSTPSLRWVTPIGQGNEKRHRITSDPVSDGVRIYAMDSRATVSAVGTDGQLLWQADLTPASDSTDDASGGGLAVAGNTLYAASAFGELHALDTATGQTRWVQRLDAPVTGAPTIANGQVYVTTRDSRGWVLNAETGLLRWQSLGAPSVTGVSGGAGPAVGAKFAIFPFPSGQISATYRREGFEAWRGSAAGGRLGHAYAGISDVSGDPVISGNRVYVGNPGGRTMALDLEAGTRIWTAPAGSVGGPVVVAGGSVFTVTDKAQLQRLDAASGARIWAADLPDYLPVRNDRRRRDIYAHYGPILAGGLLWVASDDGVMRGFSPTDGALAARVDLGAGAASRPIVVGGTAYVVTEDGALRALR